MQAKPVLITEHYRLIAKGALSTVEYPLELRHMLQNEGVAGRDVTERI